MFPTDPRLPADPLAMAGPLQPVMQRGREYSRQRTMTLGDLLLENRIVFIGSSPETGGSPVISDYLANITIQKLLFLVTENKTADIHVYINSPGGSISAGLAIYDAMQFMECSVNTYCMGLAASMAAVLLAAGTKGKRYALPNSKVMIHQPYGQVGGQVSDIEIQANEMIKEHERLNQILAKHTGQPLAVIAKESERDRYFSAEEAKTFGLVDDILLKPTEAKK
ncbi:ATP-dependent Clp protease proteolytic subunit [Fimbriiglobus ruber]|uniref:ATP-dependent Clp protease proteolytic subunit n=1 Tax=Fimbriiglobus ruber TaxID=1908690 RepID=A0A225D7N8_9BACT|nr:ATP-dependent Clp protease proteolytic subunit [Fimbriiglobus ruber]OWK36983.1 ATP-dependent Clp protease proteolytic subunit [Fimbriiglobus ruber]